jgi:hypothetical protein
MRGEDMQTFCQINKRNLKLRMIDWQMIKIKAKWRLLITRKKETANPKSFVMGVLP